MLKISIITVVRNRVSSIEKTIQSVLAQDYANIEYIIIDGNSTDGTIDIISKYANQIDYFLSEKDNSLYEALNKGVKNASGDIIGVLHVDDVFNTNNVISKIADIFNLITLPNPLLLIPPILILTTVRFKYLNFNLCTNNPLNNNSKSPAILRSSL